MAWEDDLIELTQWALQVEDLRHRMLFAAAPTDLSTTPGIAWALETSAVLAIYDAALRKGYDQGTSVGYEFKYPGKAGVNSKRADLAFKGPGRGKNWAYIEVKYYGGKGKSIVDADILKLQAISKRVQRWMLVYRVRPDSGRSQKLSKLLDHVATLDLREASFPTVTEFGRPGVCDIWLGRV